MSNDEQKMLRLERRMQQLADEFGALKLLLEKNNTSLEEFIDLAKAFKFGLKILGFVERTAVFVTKLSLAAGTLWAAWKYGIKEALSFVVK